MQTTTFLSISVTLLLSYYARAQSPSSPGLVPLAATTPAAVEDSPTPNVQVTENVQSTTANHTAAIVVPDTNSVVQNIASDPGLAGLNQQTSLQAVTVIRTANIVYSPQITALSPASNSTVSAHNTSGGSLMSAIHLSNISNMSNASNISNSSITIAQSATTSTIITSNGSDATAGSTAARKSDSRVIFVGILLGCIFGGLILIMQASRWILRRRRRARLQMIDIAKSESEAGDKPESVRFSSIATSEIYPFHSSLEPIAEDQGFRNSVPSRHRFSSLYDRYISNRSSRYSMSSDTNRDEAASAVNIVVDPALFPENSRMSYSDPAAIAMYRASMAPARSRDTVGDVIFSRPPTMPLALRTKH